MTKSDAEIALADILKPINSGVSQGPRPVYTFKQFVTDQYLPPFYRKGWKESTAGRSEQIITTHLLPELGDRLLQMVSHEELQRVLDGKARKLSYSAVAHIRWFLNAIFKLAQSDGCIASNPAAELIIPKKCTAGRDIRPLTEEEVKGYLKSTRPPREVDRKARDLRRLAARRDSGAPMEVGCRRDDPGRGASLQAGARHAEKPARPAKARSPSAPVAAEHVPDAGKDGLGVGTFQVLR